MLIFISIILLCILGMLLFISYKIFATKNICKLTHEIKSIANKIREGSHKKLYLLTIGSLLISIATLCIFWVRIEPFEFSNDSFIGTIATFIGICATLIVGWQIFSSIEVSRKMEENEKLNNDLNTQLSETKLITKEQDERIKYIYNKQKLLDLVLKKQTKELETEKIEREKQNKIFNAQLFQAKGYAFSQIQPQTAYYCFIRALSIFSELKMSVCFEVLNDLQVCTNSIKQILDEIQTLNIENDKRNLINKIYYQDLEETNLTIQNIIKEIKDKDIQKSVYDLDYKRIKIVEEAKILNKKIKYNEQNGTE